MEIYLLRHGLAVERGTAGFEDDATRPLTPKGKKQIRKISRAMAAMELEFDQLLTSPMLRARETAEIIATGLKAGKRLKLCEDLAANREPAALMRALPRMKPMSERLLLVGHEPFLSRLISLMVTGGPDLGMELAKAGLCKLTAKKLRVGKCARLEWLLTPQQMKRLHKKR